MAEGSLKYFTDIYDIPYTVVTILYACLVILTAVLRLFSLCIKGCGSSWIPELSRWMIKILFGKSEGMSDEDTEEEGGIRATKSVYIGNKKIQDLDATILGSIIFCFGLLVGITAYSTYLLEVTHICSEDSAIYCFPQPASGNSDTLNLTESDLMYPITDCSEWINASVTFQCFRYAFDAKAAMAVAGGLLAFFVVAMRTTVSIFLKLYGCLGRHCGRCLLALQIVAAILFILIDLVVAVVVMSFQLNDRLDLLEADDDPVTQRIAAYIADNGVQFLITFGTVSLLLLIDWNNYAERIDAEENDIQLEEMDHKSNV